MKKVALNKTRFCSLFSAIFVIFLEAKVLFYHRYKCNVKQEERLNDLAYFQVDFCGRCLAVEYFGKSMPLK